MKLAFRVRQWEDGHNDKGFGETLSNRRKPYGGQQILQGVALASEKGFGATSILDTPRCCGI